jgi:hypothetical protein
VQGRPEVADEGAEVDPVRRGEVDRRPGAAGAALVQHVIDGDHLHRQVVRLDQLFRGDLGLGLALAQHLVAAQIVLLGHPGDPGESGGVLIHPLRRPDALRHLGPVVGRHEHPVADLGRELARIEVVEAAVPVEADRAQHAHGQHTTTAIQPYQMPVLDYPPGLSYRRDATAQIDRRWPDP